MEARKWILLIVTLSSISALEIKHEIVKSCSVLTDKGEIDLSTVAETDGKSAAFYTDSEPGSPIYYWNPCQDTQLQGYEGCSEGEVFAIGESAGCITLSTKDDAKFSVQGEHIVIDYTSNNDDNHVKLVCPGSEWQERDNPSPFTVDNSCDDGNCFTLTSHACCFKNVAPTTAPHTGGLSAGSVLIIIAVVLAVVYVVSGVLIMKFVKKSEGAGLCPNFEFWKSLPFLVKDGVMFIFRGCKASGDGKSYDNL